MPKVMVSMPDELLAEVDAEATRTGSTRSAVLRGFAEAALRRRTEARAAAIRELLDEGTRPMGGDTLAAIRAGRPQP